MKFTLLGKPGIAFAISVYTFSLFGSMAMMSIGAVFFLAVLVWNLRKAGLSRSKFVQGASAFRPELLQTAFLALAICLSLIAAWFLPLQWTPDGPTVPIQFPKDFQKLWYFGLFFALIYAWRITQVEFRRKLFTAFFWVFGIVSAFGVVQFFTGFPKNQVIPELGTYFHANLLYGHHLSVASIWVFPLFFALDAASGFALPFTGGAFKDRRAWLWGFSVLGIITLFLGFSRTLWVGLPVGLACWGLLSLHRRKPARAWMALLGLFIAAAVLAPVVYRFPFVQARIQSGMGIVERKVLWAANFEFFKARPILGVGFGKTGDQAAHYLKAKNPEKDSFFVGHAHNVYLEMLAGVGVFGFLAWAFWVLSRLRTAFQLSPGLLSAWVVFLINGLTQVNFWEGKVLHWVIWVSALAAAFVSSKERARA